MDTESVLQLSTCWVCLGPTDSTFFQADAVRGPSVVDLVIATPKPLGNSPTATTLGQPVDADVEFDAMRTWGEVIFDMPINPAGS